MSAPNQMNRITLVAIFQRMTFEEGPTPATLVASPAGGLNANVMVSDDDDVSRIWEVSVFYAHPHNLGAAPRAFQPAPLYQAAIYYGQQERGTRSTLSIRFTVAAGWPLLHMYRQEELFMEGSHIYAFGRPAEYATLRAVRQNGVRQDLWTTPQLQPNRARVHGHGRGEITMATLFQHMVDGFNRGGTGGLVPLDGGTALRSWTFIWETD